MRLKAMMARVEQNGKVKSMKFKGEGLPRFDFTKTIINKGFP